MKIPSQFVNLSGVWHRSCFIYIIDQLFFSFPINQQKFDTVTQIKAENKQ